MFYFNYIGDLAALTSIVVVLIIGLFRLYKERKQDGELYTIKNLLTVVLSVLVISYLSKMIFPYWMDFPKFITGNYSIIEGIISNEKYWDGKEKYTNITVNNNTYIFYGKEYPPIGTNVIVEYLPNTNSIRSIKQK